MICGFLTEATDATVVAGALDEAATDEAIKLDDAPKDKLTVLTAPAIGTAPCFKQIHRRNPKRSRHAHLELPSTILQIIILDNTENIEAGTP